MDEEDKNRFNQQIMADEQTAYQQNLQNQSQENPNLENQSAYTDISGQMWVDGQPMSTIKDSSQGISNVQDAKFQDVQEVKDAKFQDAKTIEDTKFKNIENFVASSMKGNVNPSLLSLSSSSPGMPEFLMKAKWESDSAYFANRDLVSSDAHSPLMTNGDLKAISQMLSGSGVGGAGRGLGGKSRSEQNAQIKALRQQYDLMQANQFLALQSPRMDGFAKQIYSKIQGDPNLAKETFKNMDGALGELVQRIADQAPNKLAKTEFLARAAKFRVDWGKRAQGDQFQVDQEKFQQDIADQGQYLASEAQKDFTHEHKLVLDAYNSAQVSLKSGVKPEQVQKTLVKTVRDIKQGAVNNLISVSPELAMKRLEAGAYDELGPGVMQSMRMAEAALKAKSKTLDTTLAHRESEIISGKYTDYSQEDPSAYSDRDQSRIAAYNNLVSKASNVRAKNPMELTNLAQTSDDPMLRKLARSALDQIDKDPMNYAYKQGIVEKVILDGSPQSAQAYTENFHRVKSALGLPDNGPLEVNPLPKDNVSAIVNTLSSGNTENIVKTVNYINAFGDLAPNIINQVARSKDGESIKVFANQTDKRIIADIATGLSNKGVINSIGKDKVDTLAATKQAFDTKSGTIGNSNYIYMKDPDSLKAIQYGAVGSTLSRNGENASPDDFKDNVDRVSGAVKLSSASNWFGTDEYKTIPVKGMSASDMMSTIKGLTNDDFKQYGNSSNPKDANQRTTPYASDGYPVNFKDISPDRFQYIPIKYGQYALLKDGSPLRTSDGEIYTINLDAYSKDKKNQ